MPDGVPTATHASVHLTWDELACHDDARTPYPERWRATRGAALGQAFEVVRHACGDRPLVVLSGYRTPAYNAEVQGAAASQHVQGRAVDLRPPAGLSTRAFCDIVLAVAPSCGIRGVGYGGVKRFVHVDVRPSSVMRYWTY